MNDAASEITLEQGQAVLAAQPFNEHVGARLVDLGDGEATLEIEIEDRHRQQFGLVFGGVLACLADNSLAYAGGTRLGTSVLLSGFTISYLRPGRDGILRAHARVVHSNSRQAVCTTELTMVARDGTTTLCAIAQGTVVATTR